MTQHTGEDYRVDPQQNFDAALQLALEDGCVSTSNYVSSTVNQAIMQIAREHPNAKPSTVAFARSEFERTQLADD